MVCSCPFMTFVLYMALRGPDGSPEEREFVVRNPWFGHVGYTPLHETSTPPRPAASPDRREVRAESRIAEHRAHGHHWKLWQALPLAALLTIVGGAVAQIMFEGAIERGRHWLHEITPIPPTVTLGDLAGVEVERYATIAAAMRSNPPEHKPLIESLNQPGSGRIDIPHRRAAGGFTPIYALEPRAGLEPQFGALARRGLGDLHLYVLRIPAAWDIDMLDAYRHKWAHLCQVNIDWIDRWSEFRVHRLSRRRHNECRPGGQCLIVSPECKQAIFTGLEETA